MMSPSKLKIELQLKERFGLASRRMVLWTVVWTILGTVFLFLAQFLRIPGISIDLFTFEIVPKFIVVTVFGAFGGPLAGFLAGLCGTLLYDALIGGTVVWAGTAALGFGLFGFMAGWPLIRQDFANGRHLIKFVVASLLGWLGCFAVLLLGALVVGEMAVEQALLWLALPYLTTGLTTIIIFPPVVVRLSYLISVAVLQPAYRRLQTRTSEPTKKAKVVKGVSSASKKSVSPEPSKR